MRLRAATGLPVAYPGRVASSLTFLRIAAAIFTVAPPLALGEPIGVGDRLIPALGNPGYDVQHYDVDIKLDRKGHPVRIAMTMTALSTDTEPQTSIRLDFTGAAAVASVAVDGVPAQFDVRAGDGEIEIRPAVPIAAGAPFVVSTVTTGRVRSAPVAGGDIDGGFVSAAVGGYVANEPDAARSIMPLNDHPSDKATWRIAIDGPRGLIGIANGRRVRLRVTPSRRVATFAMDEPMATYLLQVAVGRFRTIRRAGPHGVLIRHYVAASLARPLAVATRRTSRQIRLFEHWFGPYPFREYGVLAPDFGPDGFALETQTLSLFSASTVLYDGRYNDSLIQGHELAHQWFGNSVSLAQWQDIWLNEGLATYAEWLLSEAGGGETVNVLARRELGRLSRSRLPHPVARPPLGDLFGAVSYQGGAIVVHAFRRRLGDVRFRRLLRAWTTERGGGTGTTRDFVMLASRVAGHDLESFGRQWLNVRRLPVSFPSRLP